MIRQKLVEMGVDISAVRCVPSLNRRYLNTQPPLTCSIIDPPTTKQNKQTTRSVSEKYATSVSHILTSAESPERTILMAPASTSTLTAAKMEREFGSVLRTKVRKKGRKGAGGGAGGRGGNEWVWWVEPTAWRVSPCCYPDQITCRPTHNPNPIHSKPPPPPPPKASMVSTEISQVPLSGVLYLLEAAQAAGKPSLLDIDVTPEMALGPARLGRWVCTYVG